MRLIVWQHWNIYVYNLYKCKYSLYIVQYKINREREWMCVYVVEIQKPLSAIGNVLLKRAFDQAPNCFHF